MKVHSYKKGTENNQNRGIPNALIWLKSIFNLFLLETLLPNNLLIILQG